MILIDSRRPAPDCAGKLNAKGIESRWEAGKT